MCKSQRSYQSKEIEKRERVFGLPIDVFSIFPFVLLFSFVLTLDDDGSCCCSFCWF